MKENMKNVKNIFFVLTLIALLVAVSTVNAADDNVTDNTISNTPEVTSNDAIVTEEVTVLLLIKTLLIQRI